MVIPSQTLDERVEVAGVCTTKLGIELPAVVAAVLKRRMSS